MAEIIDTRSDERELLLKVQAGQHEPVIKSLVKLLELRLLKLQNQMLDCSYDMFPALQAEAKLLSKMIRELKPKQ